ncbi:aminotransferase class IV [Singulisphaera sp. PoT]|uniref:aminotransferase class IV n=1 Tax=Singulisphaera sp. PoT TaxID=3411797 RepID=UPI003BF4E91C
MIWYRGRILADDALSIGVADRTFEHGLGLFETLRTYQGHPALLDRHKARMEQSAHELGLHFRDKDFPKAEDVAELSRANGHAGDTLLRITLSGGIPGSEESQLWLRQSVLPPPNRAGGALVDFGSWYVVRDDKLARHKTLNYWARRLANQSALDAGFDELLSMTPDGNLWEGSRTSLFFIKAETLFTATSDGPIVPGIMRAFASELAGEIGLGTCELKGIPWQMLSEAEEVFLTNSVRGIIPVARVRDRAWRAPGDWTLRLQNSLMEHLEGKS